MRLTSSILIHSLLATTAEGQLQLSLIEQFLTPELGQPCGTGRRKQVAGPGLFTAARQEDAHRASGSKINNSICGFGKSPGTYAARLRARVIASQQAPDWLMLKY